MSSSRAMVASPGGRPFNSVLALGMVSLMEAWRRVDLLPVSRQPEVRDSFRRYVDAHGALTRSTNEEDAGADGAQASRHAGRDLVRVGDRLPRSRHPAVAGLVLTSLNVMFKLTNTRVAAARTHLSSLVCAQLIALPFPFTAFLILDLEYPRSGLIRLDTFELLLELRNAMQGIF